MKWPVFPKRKFGYYVVCKGRIGGGEFVPEPPVIRQLRIHHDPQADFPVAIWRISQNTVSGQFPVADNPPGGFIYVCFQGNNIYDGPQYCDAPLAQEAL